MSATITDLLDAAHKSAETLTKPAQIEAACVELAAAFEARMQHHFKRGPFYKKLHKLLIESGNTDLGTKVHQYATAVSVIKHGPGASYRELKTIADLPFDIRVPAAEPHTLVDVTTGNFFANLVETLEQAHNFLENRETSAS
ncbi:MAG: hypothetical protein KC439_07100 [Yoonia sp.]|nr:hypothetical protein [Yoonia sp.]